MANERAAIKAALTGSATWTALVSAVNTKWYEEWGATGLEPKTAPADSNGILSPCAVLTMGVRTPANIANYGERAFFRLWVYNATDYMAVQTALYTARRILNNTQITADNRGKPLLKWVDDVQEFIDDELGGVVGGGSRYLALHGWY